MRNTKGYVRVASGRMFVRSSKWMAPTVIRANVSKIEQMQLENEMEMLRTQYITHIKVGTTVICSNSIVGWEIIPGEFVIYVGPGPKDILSFYRQSKEFEKELEDALYSATTKSDLSYSGAWIWKSREFNEELDLEGSSDDDR